MKLLKFDVHQSIKANNYITVHTVHSITHDTGGSTFSVFMSKKCRHSTYIGYYEPFNTVARTSMLNNNSLKKIYFNRFPQTLLKLPLKCILFNK